MQLKTDQSQQLHMKKIKELLQEFEPQQFTTPLVNRIEELSRIVENQEKNKTFMLKKNADCEKTLEEERKQRQDLQIRYNKIESDLLML